METQLLMITAGRCIHGRRRYAWVLIKKLPSPSDDQATSRSFLPITAANNELLLSQHISNAFEHNLELQNICRSATEIPIHLYLRSSPASCPRPVSSRAPLNYTSSWKLSLYKTQNLTQRTQYKRLLLLTLHWTNKFSGSLQVICLHWCGGTPASLVLGMRTPTWESGLEHRANLAGCCVCTVCVCVLMRTLHAMTAVWQVLWNLYCRKELQNSPTAMGAWRPGSQESEKVDFTLALSQANFHVSHPWKICKYLHVSHNLVAVSASAGRAVPVDWELKVEMLRMLIIGSEEGGGEMKPFKKIKIRKKIRMWLWS